MQVSRNSTLVLALVISALGWALAMPGAGGAQGASGASQTSMGSGVTVKVTAHNISADSEVWSFAVVFDTHSQDLSDDPMSSAVLVSDEGRVGRRARHSQ